MSQPNKTITVLQLYPKDMNIYGDHGNLQVIIRMAESAKEADSAIIDALGKEQRQIATKKRLAMTELIAPASFFTLTHDL